MICRSCRSHNLLAINSATDYRDFWVKDKKYALLQCQECGLWQTDVEVTADYFQEVYPTTYYAHSNTYLRPGLRERIQAYSLMGAKAKQDTPFLVSLISKLLSRFVLVKLPFKENGKVLDVGCGAGKLLNVAAQAGYETYGVEPSSAAFDILIESGHKAVRALEELDVPDEFFDVIIFNQSLEHLPLPFEAIRFVAQKLTPHGILIISVPNVSSTESVCFGQYWRHLDIPRHLSHFTYDTLLKMVQRTDLICVEKRFKFWGIPTSSLKMAVKHTGAIAYARLARFYIYQLWAVVSSQYRSSGAFISLYFTKESNR